MVEINKKTNLLQEKIYNYSLLGYLNKETVNVVSLL